MRAAQIAVAVLVGVLIAASCAMFIADDNTPGWLFAGFGLFGFLMLLGMIVSDSRQQQFPPPRP